MIRINLLPPEITEKRKAEQRWKYVVAGALLLYIVLGVFWSVMALQVMAKSADVASRQQEAQALNTQANTFKVFEDRKAALDARQMVADKALAGRMEWSKLFSEVSLVLPVDAWLTKLHVDEKALSVEGTCIDAIGDTGSSGFKPLAKLLVHLADLRQIENVWLQSTNRQEYKEQPVVTFIVGADVTAPATATVNPASAPAPPSTQ